MKTINVITREEDKVRFDEVVLKIKSNSSYQELNEMFDNRLDIDIERIKTESGYECIMYEVKYVCDESTSHSVHVETMEVPCDELFTFKINSELYDYVRTALNIMRSFELHKLIMKRDTSL